MDRPAGESAGVEKSTETGVFTQLPFEVRQFVSACRIASCYCLLTQGVNLLGGLQPALMAVVLSLMLLLEGLRWKALRSGLTHELEWTFAISTCLTLMLAWMLNGDLHGSIPIVYLLALFLSLSISATYRLHFLGLYLGSALFCLSLQATQPEWITFYPNNRIQFVDSALGLLTAMLALGYGTHQFKSSYDRQRLRVQRKNEELSQAYARLQAAMQRNHEHLHIIAHDLRNPVGAVIGLVEVCREEYSLDEGLKRDLATIEQAAQQALGLIQQLSQAAYLEERKVVLQRSPVALGKLVERSLRKLEPLARKKQQSISSRLDDGVEVEVDEGRMASILDNLIENAVKYAPMNSTIEVILERQDHQFVVRVRDQGKGIPEDQRARLFTMFGKVGSRPTGKESSTGLGLYIASMLAELHRGRLEQENLDPGCEFRLVLTK